MFDGVPLVPLAFVGVLVLAVGGWLWSRHRRDQMERLYAQVCRDQRLTPTDRPLGLSDQWLGQFGLLPRGDRHCSAVWGMEGEVDLTLGDQRVRAPCAAFEWWWENRSRDEDGPDTYHRRAAVVAALRLPEPWLMPRVRVEREGLLARFGIGGRGDFQVESEEFNRRYDVQARDREAAIRLFTPAFQEELLTRFDGATFELSGDVAMLVTSSDTNGGFTVTGGFGSARRIGTRDRVGTDLQVIRELPVARHQAVALLQSMPATWWRAVDGGGA